MLQDVVEVLRCPHGEPEMAMESSALVCPAGHRFDIARQGYVNLLRGPAPAGAETAPMVAARHAFQAAGHHRPLTQALADAVEAEVGRTERGVLVDVGAGTGHHLAAVLDRLPGAPVGLAVDIARPAARRAARAHPRIGAVVADAWAPLPIRDEVADAVLNVFAPRAPDEIGRILRPGGCLVVATPTAGHLEPLVTRLGLLQVAPGKAERLATRLAGVAQLVDRQEVSWRVALHRTEVALAVTMGPSAWHIDAEVLARHLDGLPDPIDVTMAVSVATYRRPTVPM